VYLFLKHELILLQAINPPEIENTYCTVIVAYTINFSFVSTPDSYKIEGIKKVRATKA
jgi:hypothetical protein